MKRIMTEDYIVVIDSELPVGTKFCFRNMDGVYEVKEDNEISTRHHCEKCAFSHMSETGNGKKNILCSISPCLATERIDEKYVYFVEVEEND